MTLRRIFTLHVLLPFVTLAFMIAHILELHSASSVGDFVTRLDVPRSDELDFHRFVLSRDLLAAAVYLWSLFLLVVLYPESLLHPDT